MLFALVNVASLPSTLGAAPLARRFALVRTTTAMRVAQSVLLIPMAASPTFWMAGVSTWCRWSAAGGHAVASVLRGGDGRSSGTGPSRGAVEPSRPGDQRRLTGLRRVLFDNVSLTLPIELAGLLQLSNAVLFYVFFHQQRPEEERRPMPAET